MQINYNFISMSRKRNTIRRYFIIKNGSGSLVVYEKLAYGCDEYVMREICICFDNGDIHEYNRRERNSSEVNYDEEFAKKNIFTSDNIFLIYKQLKFFIDVYTYNL